MSAGTLGVRLPSKELITHRYATDRSTSPSRHSTVLAAPAKQPPAFHSDSPLLSPISWNRWRADVQERQWHRPGHSLRSDQGTALTLRYIRITVRPRAC